MHTTQCACRPNGKSKHLPAVFFARKDSTVTQLGNPVLFLIGTPESKIVSASLSSSVARLVAPPDKSHQYARFPTALRRRLLPCALTVRTHLLSLAY